MNDSSRSLGLTVPLEGVPLARHAELATRWQALGYTDLWSSEGNAADAFTPLASVAAAAPELQLGTAIVPVYTRGAVVLAQSAAALADLAPGRFSLGLGSASRLVAEQWNGASFTRPYQRVRDTLRFLADAFDGKVIDHDYGTFEVSRFRLGLIPEKRPAVLIAALRERMLRLAGTDADGAIVTWLTAADVARVTPLVHDGGDGRRIVARIWAAPTSDSDAAHRIARRTAAAFLSGPVMRASHEWLGRGALLAEAWQRWDEGDYKASAAALPIELLDELVVHGTPADIHRRVDDYRAAGVDVPVLALLPVADVDLTEAARELAPQSQPTDEVTS